MLMQQLDGSASAAAAAEAGAEPEPRHRGKPVIDRKSYEPTGRALTLLAPIASGQEQPLVTYLRQVGSAIRTHQDFALPTVESVHFLRWVVLSLGHGRSVLAFESNHDGSAEEHVAELIKTSGAGLRAAYAFCESSPTRTGNPCTDGELATYLLSLQPDRPYAAFHVANHGRSATRILLEEDARAAVEGYLDRRPRSATDTDEIVYNDIIAGLPAATLAALKRSPPPQPDAITLGRAAAGVALLAVPLLPVLVPLVGWLLIRELLDPTETRKPDRKKVRLLTGREDFQVQNQLTHWVAMKPGPARRLILRAVLAVINHFAKRVFTQGYLGSMSTIHFARWIIIEDRLLFFSNYDGSWESYLGDFVDKASTGLTAIWSNTKLFPPTFFLAFRGARNEALFKDWTRLHQEETQLWYSAYPDLTVKNIQRNAAICAGLLSKPASPAALRAWLALF